MRSQTAPPAPPIVFVSDVCNMNGKSTRTYSRERRTGGVG
eukprot:COSAG03_NODE_24972_length_268_cov_1.218935_1_plen_39_part_10